MFSSPTQRKPESLPPMKSNDDYLILEENQTFFKMQSDLPSYRYIRLYVSVNNNIKRKYYCVLEKSFILFGLKLNNLPPEYAIPLEKYEISEEMGNVIKLVNNGIEIAMQFESESECKSWLESICNAQSSVYSYVPIRLQEIEDNSPPETVSCQTHTDIKPPALPPKIGSIDSSQNWDLNIPGKRRMSKSNSLTNLTESLPFCYDPPLSIKRTQSPNRRERPLPPPPLPPPNKWIKQTSENNEVAQSLSDCNRGNIPRKGRSSLPQNIYPDGLPLASTKSTPLTSHGRDITKLEKSRGLISQSKEPV